jgi:hypothetical protein
MFWAIALIGMGITAPAVTYVGQFEQEAACQVALKDLQRQNFKGTCVQIQRPQSTTEVGKK